MISIRNFKRFVACKGFQQNIKPNQMWNVNRHEMVRTIHRTERTWSGVSSPIHRQCFTTTVEMWFATNPKTNRIDGPGARSINRKFGSTSWRGNQTFSKNVQFTLTHMQTAMRTENDTLSLGTLATPLRIMRTLASSVYSTNPMFDYDSSD